METITNNNSTLFTGQVQPEHIFFKTVTGLCSSFSIGSNLVYTSIQRLAQYHFCLYPVVAIEHASKALIPPLIIYDALQCDQLLPCRTAPLAVLAILFALATPPKDKPKQSEQSAGSVSGVKNNMLATMQPTRATKESAFFPHLTPIAHAISRAADLGWAVEITYEALHLSSLCTFLNQDNILYRYDHLNFKNILTSLTLGILLTAFFTYKTKHTDNQKKDLRLFIEKISAILTPSRTFIETMTLGVIKLSSCVPISLLVGTVALAYTFSERAFSAKSYTGCLYRAICSLRKKCPDFNHVIQSGIAAAAMITNVKTLSTEMAKALGIFPPDPKFDPDSNFLLMGSLLLIGGITFLYTMGRLRSRSQEATSAHSTKGKTE